jgi:hypothetical protein
MAGAEGHFEGLILALKMARDRLEVVKNLCKVKIGLEVQSQDDKEEDGRDKD